MPSLPPFTPPSPGAWELERTHLTRPTSVYLAEIFPPNMMRGFGDGTREFGALLDHLEIAVINRFGYMAPRPVGAPKGAKGPPPKALFKLLQLVHPEVRRRIKRADEVFRDRLWRKDLGWWQEEVKPSIARRAAALLHEDPTGMSATDLASYIKRVTDFAGETIYWHHRFSVPAVLPVGDFVAHVMEWTGVAPGEILQTLSGLSPVSAGPVQELDAIRRALDADPDAMALLRSGKPAADLLAGLQQRPAPVGPAVTAYLDLVGLRILGAYDPAERHANEHPDLLVKAIQVAAAANDAARAATAAAAVATLRAKVPAEHRAEFDALLDEARVMYPLRDERVFYSDAIGMGIARRAILAVGDRLTREGRALDPSHLLNASSAEIIGLLEGAATPTAGELAERTRWRLETSMSDAPARLGLPPSPPPPAEWLPASAARVQRIVNLVLSLMFDTHAARAEGKKLKGFGVSAGQYEGPARVINSVDELGTVVQGDVLVTAATSPTFNIVLPLIGAVVTERGGALSHAAIVAREYGLPGVVGCHGATTTIKTGMRVRVDGGTGEVLALG